MLKTLKKVIALSIVLCMIFSTMLVGNAQIQTNDYSKHWAAKEIEKWDSKGLLNNLLVNGQFKPDQIMTRVEFAALVNRAFNLTEKSSVDLKDVSKKAWYYNDAAIALSAGYMSLDSKGNFNPQGVLSRQCAAVVLSRVFKLEAKDTGTAKLYSDYKKMSSWSIESISAMAENGYIASSKGAKYSPLDGITRAAAVKMLDNTAGELKNKAGTYTGTIARNLIVNTKNVTLKNMTIKGNLYLTQGIGDGNVTLDGVKVQGQTYVLGGGEHSIILNNTSLNGTLIVEKKDGKIRILSSGTTTVANVALNSGAILENTDASGGFKNVEVFTIAAGQEVKLDGDFEDVSIEVPGVSLRVLDGSVGRVDVAKQAEGSSITVESGKVAELNLQSRAAVELLGGTVGKVSVEEDAAEANIKVTGATVNNIELNAKAVVDIIKGTVEDLKADEKAKGSGIKIAEGAAVKILTANAEVGVTGKGTIDIAKVNADNVTIEQRPAKVEVAQGLKNVTINNQPANSSGTGTGSSSSSGNTNIAPAARTVGTQTLVLGGGSLTLSGSSLATDANGDALTVTDVQSGDTDVVTAAAISGNIVLSPVAAGATTASAIVSDGRGGTATVTFNVSAISNVIGSTWTMTYNDEFNGTALDGSKWSADVGTGSGGWGNNELEYYTDPFGGDPQTNTTVNGGILNIQLKAEEKGGQHYTSARLKTLSKFSQKYGRFEAKLKVPEGNGIWPAFWMLPADNAYGVWAASGEIDIMEARGRLPQEVYGTIHYGETWPGNKYTGETYNLTGGSRISDWHTYALEWDPGEMRWYIDGTLYQTQNNWYSKGSGNAADYTYPAPFDKEFYLLLNLAYGGNFDGGISDDTRLPGNMQVDYVRAYTRTDGYGSFHPVKPQLEKEAIPAEARTPVSGNYVYNGDFNSNTDLWLYIEGANSTGGSGSIAVDNISGTNYGKFTITSGGSQDYSIQMVQDNIPMVKGRYYKVSFDAKASAPRTITTKVDAGPDGGYVSYSNAESINLSDTFSSYSYTFQMTQNTDIDSRLEFNAGTNANAVWIGNVVVEEIDSITVDEDAAKTPIGGGNHIYNGTFDQGGPDRMIYWHYTTSGAISAASVNESTRELKAEITDGGSASGAIKLVQRGLNLIQGQDYKVTFNARAAEPRTIEVQVLSSDGSTNYSTVQTISLAASMEEKTFSFTMPADITDIEGQIVFSLGGADIDVYLDDVSMIRTSVYVDPSVVLFPLKNGDFGSGMDLWNQYIIEGASGSITVSGEQAQAAITAVGANPWSTMLTQEGMSFFKDVEYQISFDASSTTARQIEVIIENAGYNRSIDQMANLTTGTNTYTYTFTAPRNEIANLKFLLGNVNGQSLDSHTVTIDNVVCEVKVARQYKSILSNSKFNNGTTDWIIGGYEDGVNVVPAAADGALQVAISSTGSASWTAQVEHMMTVESGKSYVLTFDASSDVARNIQVTVEHKGDDYHKYLDVQTIGITGTKKTFTFTFTSDANDAGVHLDFLLGRINADVGAHTVSISNLSLIENPFAQTARPVFTPVGGEYNDSTPLTVTISCATSEASIYYTTDGSEPTINSTPYTTPISVTANKTIKAIAVKTGLLDSTVASVDYTIFTSHPVLNGTFDTNTDNWTIWNKPNESSTGMRVTSGELEVYVPDPGYEGWENWGTQIYQTHLTLEAGKTYTISFDARATAPKNIWVEVDNGNTAAKYLQTTVASVTTSNAHYSFNFTMPGATDYNGKLILMFGNGGVEGTTFAGQSVFIDNITLAEATSPGPEPQQPVSAAAIWYFNNTAATGVTPSGEGLQDTTGSAVGWDVNKTFNSTTPSYWYSPTVSGTYNAGSWSFVLWTNTPSVLTTFEVSLYVTNADGSGSTQIGTTQAVDVTSTGGGNHTTTFNFTEIGQTELDNQRVMVKIVKTDGEDCQIGYTSDFQTRLITPNQP